MVPGAALLDQYCDRQDNLRISESPNLRISKTPRLISQNTFTSLSRMSQLTNDSLLELAITAATQAGTEIIKVYNSDFAVEHKEDKSPLTLADKNAHAVISKLLAQTELPLLSEEGKHLEYNKRKDWQTYWLVDPLDGTKEFVKRNGEFTVNIALIKNNQPIMGVIFVPVKNILYFGDLKNGAFKIQLEANANEPLNLKHIRTQAQKLPRKTDRTTFTVVGSRSHMSQETEAFIQTCKEKHGEIDIVSMGSSLKICLVAEGVADIYPRFAPTMEWDTAAGHAIVSACGKHVIDHTTQKEMTYNKENLLNNWFVVK